MSDAAPIVRRSWFRSVPFQILIAGLVSISAPGMWDALGGLGAGGAAEPYAVSGANAIVYALFAVVAVLAAAVNNRIGLKWALFLGTLGFPIYGGGLYANNQTAATGVMFFGAVMCGISAGLYWTAEAAIVIGYPSPRERGFYLACWQTAKASGPIIGGAINLGLNINRNGAGSVGSATYIVFIVIMCLGAPIATLLSPAEKVWRKDGTKVVVRKEASWAAEYKVLGKLMISKRILLLYPVFFISYFYNPFISTFLTKYFTVRSRALSSFFTNFAGIFSSFLLGYFVDKQSINIKTRAKVAFTAIVTILIGTWVWAIVLQQEFYENKPLLDWSSPGFGRAYAMLFFMTFAGQAFQQFLYWLVGQYSTDISDLSRYTGLLRGVEALGQTVAWAMQSQAQVNHFITIGLNFGILLLAIPPTWYVLSQLEHNHEIQDETSSMVGTIVDGGEDQKEADSLKQASAPQLPYPSV